MSSISVEERLAKVEGSSATTGVDMILNLFIIPGTPLGTMAALASMTLALAAVMLHKRKT